METKQLTKIIKRNHHWLNLRGIYIDIMPVETAQNILENPRLDPNHHHDKDDSWRIKCLTTLDELETKDVILYWDHHQTMNEEVLPANETSLTDICQRSNILLSASYWQILKYQVHLYFTSH